MPKITNYTILSPIILVLLFLLVLCTDRSFGGDTLRTASCSSIGSYAANSSYEASLNMLLSSLAANASSKDSKGTRFFNTSVDGHDEHGRLYTIFGLYLCRGDDVDRDCQTCVPKATRSILQECPTRPVVAAVWYVDCMVRYSNESIFGKVDYSQPLNITDKKSGNVTKNANKFNDLVGRLMHNLILTASQSAKRYATQEAESTGFWTVYSEAQCTPDLSTSDCHRCLTAANNVFPDCCSSSKGAQVLTPSCYAMYNIRPFYTLSPSPSSPLPLMPPPNPVLPLASGPFNRSPITASTGNGKRINFIAIALFALVAIFAVQISLVIYVVSRRRKKRLGDVEVFHQIHNQVTQFQDDNDFPNVESLRYDLTLLQIATNFFSDDNKLGEGGFGGVYKGVLSNGQEIAVKRLSVCSNHGVEQFKNEVAFVAKLQHRNLVRLLGFCLSEHEKLLVYEFVPNKSLDFILFDPIRREELDWPTRYKIISGIAKGMLYLHEDSRLRIVHRDLKASNILLDSNMNPKISDFGTAKHFSVDESHANTSRIAGTFGYMAPEYLLNGEFSLKSDVYSFGVLVLEIVTGKKSTGFRQSSSGENLLKYAWKHWANGTLLEIMDSSLKESYSHNEVIRCIQLGLLCVQGDSENRPTMASVVISLNSDYVLPMPYQPGLLISNNIESNAEVKEPESEESTSRLIWLSSSSDASVT